MTNRPENNFTNWFGSLLVLQAVVLVIFFSTTIWEQFYSENGGISLSFDDAFGYRILNLLVYAGFQIYFFQIVRLHLDARTAFYACCVLFSSFYLSWHIQLPSSSGLGAIFLFATLSGIYHYLKTNNKSFFWLIYTCLGLAIVTAGLQALFLFLATLMVYLMFRIKMNLATLRKIKLGKGLLLSFLICIPWIIYSILQSDGHWWFSSLFPGPEAVQALIPVKSENEFTRILILILLLFIPFGFFLPGALKNGWKFRHKKPLLLLASLTVFLIILSALFADKIDDFILLSAFPFAGILTGNQLSQTQGRTLSKMKVFLGLAGLTLFALVLPYASYNFYVDVVSAEGIFKNLFYLQLLLVPVGTIIALFLFQQKKTDVGMTTIAVTYILFNLLLAVLTLHHHQIQSIL